MGALILGVRTILPPPDERVLSGGAGETLEGLEGLRVRALSVAVVHRTVRDDPTTERVIEVFSEPAAATTSGLAALLLDRTVSPALRGDGCALADRILRTARRDDRLENVFGKRRSLDAFAAVNDTAGSPGRSCP